jgi:CRISPR/Cas system-associated endoribonuclease Cas2
MARNDRTSAIVDSLLKLAVTSTTLTAGLLLPNLLTALDKPLRKYFDHLDERDRERQLRRVVTYMKHRRLLSGDYDHGLQITERGKKRLSNAEFTNLEMHVPAVWDKQWRLVFYDIPESQRLARKVLVTKLNELGFFQLQRSVFIHPFPCREVIEKITLTRRIERFVSYVETSHLDNESRLVERFQKKYPTVMRK